MPCIIAVSDMKDSFAGDQHGGKKRCDRHDLKGVVLEGCKVRFTSSQHAMSLAGVVHVAVSSTSWLSTWRCIAGGPITHEVGDFDDN